MSGSFSWGEDDLLLQVKVPSEMPRLSFTTSSGDVRMDGISVGNLQGKTASGDVKVMGVRTEELHISATSGDLELEDVKVKKADLSTTSGDVDIEGTKAEKIHVNTGSGDIKALTSGNDIQADLNSVSGDIRLDMEQSKGMEATVNTVSGDIGIKWQGRRQEVGRGCYRFGEGSSKVKANTVSGDIEIDGR